MRKWNYFLTLLVGASLTLTSCIDTTEPAGIEAMRTSKSEWLKAKAAYENALVQLQLVEVEKEKVAVESAKIELELKKLDLKKQSVLDSLEIAFEIAQTDFDIESLKNQLEQAQNNRERQAILDSLELALEMAETTTEIEQLKMELAQAQSEQEKQAILDELALAEEKAASALAIAQLNQQLAQLEADKEDYLLQRELQLLGLYEQIAAAEQSYLQTVTDLKMAMLTYKDEAMQAKLDQYEGELDGYNSQLNAERADLVRAKLDKWTYDNSKAKFVEGLPVEKAQIEKDIELQKSLIAKLDSLNKLNISGDITALYAQIDAYDDELEALEEKEEEMLKELEAMKTLDPKVAEEIAGLRVELDKLDKEYDEIEEKYEEDYTLTIAKDDVNEAMVNTLVNVLSSYTDEFEAAFEENEDHTYNMIADFVLEDEIQNVVYKEDDGMYGHYNYIISQIKYGYKYEYANAYTSVVTDDWAANIDNMFDEDGNVKDIYLARLKAAQDRNSKDEAALIKAEKEYNETVEEWGKAYDAYLAAAAKFQGYTNDSPEFDAVWEAVQAYQKAKNDTLNYFDDGKEAGKPAQSLHKKIANFIKIKNAVDGQYTGDFVEKYDSIYVPGLEADEQDDIALGEFNAEVLTWTDESAFENFVGGKLPINELGSSGWGYDFNLVRDAAENGGTLAQFLVASEKLFGTEWFSVTGDIILPIKDGDKYVVSENVPDWAKGGVYAAYDDAVKNAENAEKYEAILNSVEKWVALVDKLEAQNEACVQVWDAIGDELQANTDQQTEINDKIIELQNLNLDNETLWAKEFECYKIFGTETGHAYDNNEFDYNNPYIYGSPALDVTTEASVINDAKQLVQDAITEATGTYNYWYYDPVNKTMVNVSSASLASLIETAEDDLAELEEDLEQINIVIAAVKEYDAYAGTWDDFFTNSGLELGSTYETEIAECEAAIAALEEDIKTVNAAIAALIAAYEAGELDVELPGEGA